MPEEYQIAFHHITNGIIFMNDTFYPFMEFKCSSMRLDKQTRFTNIDSNCAWFMVRDDNLIGPIKVRYDDGKTIIDDEYEFYGESMANISTENESLIEQSDIPDWILKTLMNSVEIY